MIASSIIIALTLLFFILFLAAYKMTHPAREIGKWSPSDLDADYESITIETSEALTLQGWWIENEKKSTIILLHGYATSRWNTRYMKPVMEVLVAEGHNILTFDFRGHGRSEGKYTSIGFHELKDLQASLEWLKTHKREQADKIGILGYSMGGIVTLRGLKHNEEVDCGIVDSAPLILEKTFKRGLKYFGKLPTFLFPLIKPFALWLINAPLLNLQNDAKYIKQPLLIIAGKHDPLIPEQETRDFYQEVLQGNSHVDLWLTDAGHVRTITRSPQHYREKICSFLEKWLEEE